MPRYGPRPSRKTRKQSRTLPVKGRGEDKGKYFRCWNCGFVCAVDRDQLGDDESRSGIVVEEVEIANSLGSQFGTDELDVEITLQSIGFHHEVIPQASSDGENQVIRHDHKGTAASGCPFCGTLNWRGDY